jgi:adenine-specific DNA-methyltransferase
MSELIQQYIDNGVSWKYTSVLVNPGKKEYVGSTVDGDGNDIRIYARKNPVIKSIRQVATADGISEKDAYKKYGTKIFRTTNAQSSIRTRIIAAKKEMEIVEPILSIEYVPKTGKNKGVIYEQFYKDDICNLFVWLRDTSEEIDGVLYKKELQGTYWDYTAGTKNLTKEGGVQFANGKKPLALMQRIISLFPRTDITILDYFAGSGSTGHAVISQNQEDAGVRQFILCTNNQNNICRQKTYPRLRNVICGYTNEKGKQFEPSAGTLKYYKVGFIPISERVYYEYADELLKHVRELVELENGINFTGNSEIAIVLTDEEVEAFIGNVDEYEKCRRLYRGHDILLSAEQEAKLQERGITVCVIPDYYYRELEGGK